MRALEGTVVSNRMTKTLVVRADRLVKHKKYLKFYRVSRKFKADVDDAGAYQIGDIVEIRETRPLSRGKRWKVVGVRPRAPVGETGENTAGDSAAGV